MRAPHGIVSGQPFYFITKRSSIERGQKIQERSVLFVCFFPFIIIFFFLLIFLFLWNAASENSQSEAPQSSFDSDSSIPSSSSPPPPPPLHSPSPPSDRTGMVVLASLMFFVVSLVCRGRGQRDSVRGFGVPLLVRWRPTRWILLHPHIASASTSLKTRYGQDGVGFFFLFCLVFLLQNRDHIYIYLYIYIIYIYTFVHTYIYSCDVQKKKV